MSNVDISFNMSLIDAFVLRDSFSRKAREKFSHFTLRFQLEKTSKKLKRVESER